MEAEVRTYIRLSVIDICMTRPELRAKKASDSIVGIFNQRTTHLRCKSM